MGRASRRESAAMSSTRPALIAVLLAALAGPLHGQEDPGAYDEALLKDAGLKTDNPALLEFFRKRTLSEKDQAKLAQTVRRLGDRNFSVRERASTELMQEGRTARRYLLDALTGSDPEILRRARHCLDAIDRRSDSALPLAAGHLLALRRPAGAAEVILNYLPFADDEALEEELLTALIAVGLREGKMETCLVAALKDRVTIRRAAAALALGRWPEARSSVRPLLQDPAPKVRLRAAQGLIQGKDKEAVPTLLSLVAEAPLPVAWSAEELLCRVAGEQAPPIALGSGQDTDRRRCGESWRNWWREHQPTLDMATIDLDRRLLGLTLIVTLDGANQGKVWEIGNDGRPRWEVKNVQGPIDARVVSGNRVLIAEYYGQRVTERDWQGKILWEYKVPTRPIAVQRLANGNTLVASNSVIEEVTRDHKVVFRHAPRHGSISAVQKLRTGNFVYTTYNGMVAEVNGKGADVRSFRFPPAASGLFTIEALASGRFLVPLTTSGKIVEFDTAGKVVWEVACTRPNAATRLPNGNILYSSMDDRRVTEIDRNGKVIWEQRLDGRPFRVRRR